MIIALLSLAFAMIVGGLLAVFLGWDIVLVERGWTMVLAGSVSAGSGAVLLGITVAITKLIAIHDQLSRIQGEAAEGVAVEEYTVEELSEETESAPTKAAMGLSFAALSGALLGSRIFKKRAPKQEPEDDLSFFPEEAHRPEEKPAKVAEEFDLSDRAAVEPGFEPVSAAPARDEAADLKVPDFLLANRQRDEDRKSDVFDLDDVLAPPVPAAEKAKEREEADTVTAAAWPEAASEPAEAETEEEAAPEEKAPATIIGTYNSGDNRYVMFSDGSIEAHTPSGVFRFNSLEELKEFIAGGGESSSSTASI